MEGREHRELKLDCVAGHGDEGRPVIPGVFREFDLVCLGMLAVCMTRSSEDTHHIVLDSINFGVGDVALDTPFMEIVLDFLDLQNTNLVEGPASNLLCEGSVRCLDLLPRTAFHFRIKPRILQHLRRSNDGEAC